MDQRCRNKSNDDTSALASGRTFTKLTNTMRSMGEPQPSRRMLRHHNRIHNRNSEVDDDPAFPDIIISR